MPKAGAGLLTSGSAIQVALLCVLAVILMAVGTWIFLSSRQTAAQRERKRRLAVNRTGRMGDATIVDVRDSFIFYTYEVRGVAYATSQDASELRDLLPADTSILGSPVGIKYCTNNPANSIVICEEWSGLRAGAPPAQEVRTQETAR